MAQKTFLRFWRKNLRPSFPLVLGAFALGALARRARKPPAETPVSPTLRPYLDRRLVILNASDPFYAAAHAMKAHDIGAVLVERGGYIAGIVTDRDITLHLISEEAQEKPLSLGEIMSPLTSSVPPSASMEDVIRVMIRDGVRRVPIIDENGKARGFVSLDDLLMDGAIDAAQAGEILRGQIHRRLGDRGQWEVGPRPRRPRAPAHLRSESHAASTLAHALDVISGYTGLKTRTAAREAFLQVVGLLLRRITPDEAKDLLAQLPSLLREHLMHLPKGPDKSIEPETIRRELAATFGVTHERADEIAHGVIRALEDLVSPGEIFQVFDQLPLSMREYFATSAGLRA